MMELNMMRQVCYSQWLRDKCCKCPRYCMMSLMNQVRSKRFVCKQCEKEDLTQAACVVRRLLLVLYCPWVLRKKARQCSIFHASRNLDTDALHLLLPSYQLLLCLRDHFANLGWTIRSSEKYVRKALTSAADLHPSMGDLKHRMIRTNGINMHIAEQGSGA